MSALAVRKRLGWMLRPWTHWPGGRCGRCSLPWSVTARHHTQYETFPEGGGMGCFVLCELCWKDLARAERLKFYRALVDEWQRQSPDKDYSQKWSQIEHAVLAGK